MPNSMPPDTFVLDHLVVVAQTLESGARYIEQKLGVKPEAGGQHPGVGTHNLLMSIGGMSYLEIIAPDPSQSPPEKARPFGMDDPAQRERVAVRPRLAHYIMRCSSLRESVKSLDYPLSTPTSMSRGKLAWELALSQFDNPGGVHPLPSLIDWGKHESPGSSLPASGASLQALHVSTAAANAKQLERLATEPRLKVSVHRSPMLAAEFQSPNGWAILD